MSERPYVIDQMISAKSIAARIEELCDEIRTEYSDTDKLVVVGLLRGSFVFIADLVRELDLPVEPSEDFQRPVGTAPRGVARSVQTPFVADARRRRAKSV